MKNKIITLIIGALIGSIITSSIFLIFKPKTNKTDFSKMPSGFSEMDKGERPSFPNSKEKSCSDDTNSSHDENIEEKSE